MSGSVTWLHDEMLGPAGLTPGRPAVFVFDEAWIAAERLSLKRVVFMYECLLELPGVTIRKGDVVDEVSRFAAEQNATTIETRRSPLPRIQRQGEALGVTWLDPPPLVSLPQGVDLKRFSRYWRKAERTAFLPTEQQPDA